MTVSGRIGSVFLLVVGSGCCTIPPERTVATAPAAPQAAVEPAGPAQQPPEPSVTAPPAPATTPPLADVPSSTPTTPQTTVKPPQSAPPMPEPAAAPSGSRAPAPAPQTVAKPAAPGPKAIAKPATPASKPTAPAAAVPVAKPPAPAARLDLTTLKQELTDTKAIGFFSKLTLKNQMDDLLDRIREFHQGQRKSTPADLRRSYDLLIMKVLSLVQDDDKKLASDILSSREALWGLLVDPAEFAKLDV